LCQYCKKNAKKQRKLIKILEAMKWRPKNWSCWWSADQKFVPGWIDGCKSRFKDCLQQSKKYLHFTWWCTISHVHTSGVEYECKYFYLATKLDQFTLKIIFVLYFPSVLLSRFKFGWWKKVYFYWMNFKCAGSSNIWPHKIWTFLLRMCTKSNPRLWTLG
jgi:hypothetical protein